MQVETCPYCQSTDTHLSHVYENIEVFQCNNCGEIFGEEDE